MEGCILILSEVDMAYLNQEFCPITCCAHASTKKENTPGIWKHKWRPIKFCLIVDDFGIEYVGERHIQHLRDILKQHNKIIEDWAGTKCSGKDIEWDYATKHVESTCYLCSKGYTKDLLLLLEISHLPSLISYYTNTARLFMEPRFKWQTKKIPSLPVWVWHQTHLSHIWSCYLLWKGCRQQVLVTLNSIGTQ